MFLFVGATANFLPLWLQSHGWQHDQMGWLEGLKYVAIAICPILWGRWADRLQRPVFVLSIAAWGGLLCFLPVALTTQFAIVFAALTVFNLFRVAAVPLADVITIEACQRAGEDYGRVRIWGSWGFIIGGALMAGMVHLGGRSIIPTVLVALLAATALMTRVLPEAHATPNRRHVPFRELLAQKNLRGFLLVAFLWRLSGQGLYMFLPLHLSDLGVADSLVPVWWTVGVLAEIVLIRFAPNWFGRLRPGKVLLLCYAMCVVQFGLTAVIEDPNLLLGVMLLHGFTFGLAYYTSVLWLAANVEDSARATAQALFQSVSFGIGGSLSAVAAGYLFRAGRGPLMFGVAAVAAIGAVLATAVLLKTTRDQRPAASNSD